MRKFFGWQRFEKLRPDLKLTFQRARLAFPLDLADRHKTSHRL